MTDDTPTAAAVPDPDPELDTTPGGAEGLMLMPLLGSTGLMARTGLGAQASRTLTAASPQVVVLNGDGVAGDPTVDVVPGSLDVAALGGGPLGVSRGGTGAGTANGARVAINRGVAALTDAATTALDLSAANFLTWTLGGSRTLAAPSNVVAGATWMLEVRQPGSGGPYTVTWNAAFDWGAAGAPTLSTTAGAVDVVSLWSPDGTKVRAAILKGFG